MKPVKSEIQLACEIIRILDGVSVEAAQHALARAQQLLLKTQIVRGNSPLLAVEDETDGALNR